MVESFLLAGLALTGVVQVWHIIVLSFLVGMVVPFDMAARHALTVRLVDRKQDLSNAIALSAAMFNGSRLIGPALGGLVLAATSAGMCFLINAFSFAAVIWAIALMRLAPEKKSAPKDGVLEDIKGGLRYVWREKALRYTLILLSLGSLTSSVHAVLLPVLAKQALGGGAQELGWLGGAVGVGAFSGAVFLASRRTVEGVETWIGLGPCILGMMLLLIGQSSWLPVTLAGFVIFGFGMVTHFAAGNTILQTVVQEDKRGRIMAFYTMALIGMTPLGSLLFGYMNDHYGYMLTLSFSGVCALVGGAAFLLWLPRLRGHLRKSVEGYDIVP
jgi:MFS family permease